MKPEDLRIPTEDEVNEIANELKAKVDGLHNYIKSINDKFGVDGESRHILGVAFIEFKSKKDDILLRNMGTGFRCFRNGDKFDAISDIYDAL